MEEFRTGATKLAKYLQHRARRSNCGTLSTIAWPFLQSGVDASLTISDYESHLAALDLHISALLQGPAAQPRWLLYEDSPPRIRPDWRLNENSVVVLICTEGKREYEVPLSVSTEDPALLTQRLVQINSANPLLGSVPGPGEKKIAEYIKAWLEHRNIETHWIEVTPGRPSIVGVVRGSGGGKSLMLNGHIDTVTIMGYDGDPLSGERRDGKIYGRGSSDMKGGCGCTNGSISVSDSTAPWRRDIHRSCG